MGKGGSAPAGPDYTKLIPLQSQADLEKFNTQLQASRTNTVGPTGSSTWSTTPQFDESGYAAAMDTYLKSAGASAGGGALPAVSTWQDRGDGGGGFVDGSGAFVGASPSFLPGGSDRGAAPTRDQFTKNTWTLTNTLSPEQQQLYDATTGAQTNAARAAQAATGKPLELIDPSTGGADQRIRGYEDKIGGLDPSSFYTKAADALYSQNTRYLDPQYETSQRSLESRLGEQGFVPGTPAFQQAMEQFSQGKERAYADARDRATTLGVSAGNSMYGNELGGLQAQIAAALQGGGLTRQSGMDQNTVALAERNQPLAELSQLLGRSNAPTMGPTTASTPNLQSVDQIGAANQDYANKLGVYNAGVQSDNATTSQLASLAAMYLMFSDRRLKTGIVAQGRTTSKGFPVYEYEFVGEPGIRHVGVMADEVSPSMRVRGPDGFWLVDYSQVGEF